MLLGHVFVFHSFLYFYLYFEACFYFLFLENFVDRDSMIFSFNSHDFLFLSLFLQVLL